MPICTLLPCFFFCSETHTCLETRAGNRPPRQCTRVAHENAFGFSFNPAKHMPIDYSNTEFDFHVYTIKLTSSIVAAAVVVSICAYESGSRVEALMMSKTTYANRIEEQHKSVLCRHIKHICMHQFQPFNGLCVFSTMQIFVQ